MCISDINILEEYPRSIPTPSVLPIDEVVSERKIKIQWFTYDEGDKRQLMVTNKGHRNRYILLCEVLIHTIANALDPCCTSF